VKLYNKTVKIGREETANGACLAPKNCKLVINQSKMKTITPTCDTHIAVDVWNKYGIAAAHILNMIFLATGPIIIIREFEDLVIN
jgi:hypothetical protein